MKLGYLIAFVAVVVFAVLIVSRTNYAPVVGTSEVQVADAGVEEPVPEERPFERQSNFDEERVHEQMERNAALAPEQLRLLDDEAMMTEVTRRLLVRRGQLGLEKLNPTEQNVLRAEALAIRVQQDGFLGWWLSPWANDFEATLVALKETKALPLLPLLAQTLKGFPGASPSPDLDTRRATLEEVMADGLSPFYELDERARELLPQHADLVAKYVRAHWDELDLRSANQTDAGAP